jgi:hypothetical protein
MEENMKNIHKILWREFQYIPENKEENIINIYGDDINLLLTHDKYNTKNVPSFEGWNKIKQIKVICTSVKENGPIIYSLLSSGKWIWIS